MSNINDCTGMIQNLLYCFPLYNYINREQVNILVIGYSDISEKFIDLAFEMAQVSGYKLHITVISGKNDAKNDYLNSRPVFTDFFSVDDKLSNDDYGKLLFVSMSFDELESDILEILSEDEKNKYAYLFIDTDNDDLNRIIADLCIDCRDLLDAKFVINCVTETSIKEDRINCVCRTDSIEKHKDYKTLRSMAFNCHLVWNNSKLLDFRKLQRQFLSNYSYVGCLSYVISLKYKLASVGIDFLDPAAPERFYSLINSNTSNSKKMLEDMVANEHKRWNVNMICRGFQKVTSLENYVNGIESKAKGYHPCLVRGSGYQELNSSEWTTNKHAKWDDKKANLKRLDDLDKVSVDLHRAYMTRADQIRCENLLLQSDIDIIDRMLEGSATAKRAFKKYYICFQEISAGVNGKVALYEHYYSALLKELKTLPVNQAKIVSKRLNALAESCSPIVESQKFIDYKQYDVDLIERIPFILTYKSNLHIGIPFDLVNIGSSLNTAAFRIVESSLVINPSRITYICEFERSDFDILIKMLDYAIKSMDSHYLRSQINICLLTSCILSEQDTKTIIGVSNRINSVEIVKNEAEFAEYSKKRHLRIFEFTRTRSSSLIERYEYCSDSHYKYDRNTNTFDTTNCNEIRYICFDPYIKISDIFELKSSIDEYGIPDMQKDYMKFWEHYKSNKRENMSERKWKALCALLKKQDEGNQFEIRNLKEEKIRRPYLIEKVYLDSIKKLCKQIKRIDDTISCRTEVYSNNAYRVSINAPSEFHKVIYDLLCEGYKLCDPNSVNIRIIKGKPYFYYNSLNTGVISADTIREVLNQKKVGFSDIKFSDIKTLLEKIRDQEYIRNLSGNEKDGISFSYSTHQVKAVMTQEGRILELFVYYKLLESGLFDDVANSVEIHWGNNEAENEIDIIATQGNKVLIIECKAQIVLDQEFYNKLLRLNEDYGLNSFPVIVADTLEIPKYLEENARKIEMGNRVGIRTLFRKYDIADIGNVLRSVIDNN